MTIGVLKEPSPETRVSLLPEHIATLKKWNVDVLAETGADRDSLTFLALSLERIAVLVALFTADATRAP